ncbi:HAD family acid phosphatase [Spiroplasma endosymbiont of Polydrusus pterygomalis]|uniref:HAD family acid phosphatase n=1 Tax=Spiroplasma endosymbiont of Polydrusus pterygomalis TaxID=3139327 RepID=UPI003CCA8D0E
MKKILKTISGLIISITTSLSFIGCNKNENSYDLRALQTILWQESAERKISLLNTFRAAIKQYDDGIAANKDHLSLDVIYATADKKNAKNNENDKNYTVQYNQANIKSNKYVPIVITDLDETFVNNIGFSIYQFFNPNMKDPDYEFKRWVDHQVNFDKQIYDGVLEFVKHVWTTGGIVLFDSNRFQGENSKYGDETIATKKLLENNYYPKAFLDSYVWWMQGVTKYNTTNYKDLISKEDRFNYINNSNFKLSSKANNAMQIKNWENDLVPIKNVPAHIIMRLGDNINDFHSNLTNSKTKDKISLRNEILNNKNFNNLIGKVGDEIWFTKNEKGEIIEHFWSKNTKNNFVDNDLKNLGFVKEIKLEVGNIGWQEIYIPVGGNDVYGNFLWDLEKKYGHNLLDLVKLYFKKYESVWN